MRHHLVWITRLALLTGTLFALGCGGESLGPNGEKVVKVEDNSFSPATKTIAVGDKVMWQWTGSNQHTVTWVTESGTGNSALQSTGTYTRDFSAAGTYAYYCTVHGTPTSGMRGSVVVQ